MASPSLEEVGAQAGGDAFRRYLAVSFNDDGTLKASVHAEDKLGLTPTAVKTGGYTASAGDFVPVDTTGGSVTVTLPNAPADGSVVCVKLVLPAVIVASAVVACAGSDVFNKAGGSTTATLTLLSQAILVQYKASTKIWYVVADDLPLAQLDTRYPKATITTPATNDVLQYDSPSGTWKNVASPVFGVAQGIRPNETSIVYSGKSGFTPSGIVQFNMFSAEGYAKGVSPTGTVSRMHGFSASMKDDAGVDNWLITGAANNGSGLIRLTVTSLGAVNGKVLASNVATGDPIAAYGVGGTTEANGQWVATVVDATHIDLQGSTFSHAYTSGGTLTNRGAYYGFNALVWPTVDRTGLTGTATNCDDVACYTAFNRGTGVAADCFYIARNSANFPSTPEFYAGYSCDAYVTKHAFGGRARINAGSAMFEASNATYDSGAYPIRIPNNTSIVSKNNAGSGDVLMWSVNTSDHITAGALVTFPQGLTASVASAFSSTVSFGDTLFLNDGVNIFCQTTTGSMIGTTTTQKLAFYGATPIVKVSNTTDLRVALINYGLYASGGATPLNLNGGGLAAALGQFGTNPAASGVIGLSNGGTVYGRNNANSGDVALFHTNASDNLAIDAPVLFNGLITVVDGVNIGLGTGTGTKIGTSIGHKLALWNKTPIVQPTTGITGATRVGGGGTTVTTTDTYGGYTLAQLAAVIINTGLAA
jgi:hypothetical protein